MSFTMPKQPRTGCPLARTEVITVGVWIDSHIVNYGTFKFLSLTFNSATVADSTEITISGQTLTVDSTNFYTKNTFSWDTSAELAASAFALMIRANFHFNDVWVLTDPDNPTQVILYWRTREELDGWDLTALTGGGDMTVNAFAYGVDPETSPYFLWYRLYEDSEPVSEVRGAGIPFDPDNPFNTVDFELGETIGLLLDTPFPDLEVMTVPELVPEALGEYTLRVGPIEKVNCENDYKTALESFTFKVANTVVQDYEGAGFLSYCYTRGNVAKFLTDRPECLPMCFDSYEWLYIYLDLPAGSGDADVQTGAFKVLYNFYDSAGVQINVNEIGITFPASVDFGIWAIPVGPSHDSVEPFLSTSVASMDVQVFFLTDIDAVQNWLPYSEVKAYNLMECACHEEEVYFLNWRGGFDTLNFRKITQFDLETEAEILSSKHIRETFESVDEYYNTGARKAAVDRADEVFTLISDRIKDNCGTLCFIEQFLTSACHYIRYKDNNGRNKARRIVLDYERTTLYKEGEVIRLAPTFVYLDELNL